METKTYTIPLRREFQKTSRNRKANKAITGICEFVVRHTKVAPQNVLIGEELNEYIWSRGMSNPPAKVQVEITKDVVKKDTAEYTEAYVNLVGIKRKKIEAVQKKGVLQKQTLKDKLSGAVSDLKSAGKSSDAPAEEKQTEEKQEEKQSAVAAKPVAQSKKAAEPKTEPKVAEKVSKPAVAENTSEKQ
jgi:large subunit ribosomal protein L31e